MLNNFILDLKSKVNIDPTTIVESLYRGQYSNATWYFTQHFNDPAIN